MKTQPLIADKNCWLLAVFGVERVFERLLDDAGWPFDNLPSRDFVRDVVGKDTDAAHTGIMALVSNFAASFA